MLFPLVLAILVAPAAPSPQGSDTADGGWILLDTVDTVINDDIVTGTELARIGQQLIQSRRIPITTQEELADFRNQVRAQVVSRTLRSQAGATLGAPVEELDQVLEDHFKDVREREGLVRYVEDLESRGITADRVHDEARDDYYAENWTNRTIGRDDAEGQRPRRDRFVRPGEMRHRYRQSKELYGNPATAHMTRFSMKARPGMTVDEAAETCESLRRRAADGEALEALAREYGNAASAPLEAPIDQIIDADLRQFAQSAAPGKVSKALVLNDPETPADTQFDFFKLVRRSDAEPPLPFVDGRVQEDLSRRTLSIRDQWHLRKSQLELIEAAYISPPLEAL
jgi:hypothetical protein